MNTQNTQQEPSQGANNATAANKLTLEHLAMLLREAGYNAWVNDIDVAIELNEKRMIGLEHLTEHKALSLRTSLHFYQELPEAILYQIANELTQKAIGVRIYQQWNKAEILSIALCFEHFYFDEGNVNAAVLAALIEHFLAEIQKAFTSVEKILMNLNDTVLDLLGMPIRNYEHLR